MNILVSGGAGFIASHIVDAYIGLGHTVSVIDNLSTGKKENLNPKARLFEVDIRDAPAVKRVFAGGKYDVVNHHAAQIDVRRSVADPAFDASVNLVGALTLFDAAVASGVRRVIFASSGGAIYGEQDVFPADETHPTRPISPYGVAKLSTEQYLYFYSVAYGVVSVCLRYANVYGPRQNPEGEAGVVAIFASRMLAGGQPLINGDGKQTRDYVFVRDVASANVLALSRTTPAILNVGTGVETDVNRLFASIRKATGSGCEERHGEAKLGEQQRSVLDNRKIKKELGWAPSVSLDEGVASTVEYFRTRLNRGA
jgi:UDP-glucose 4-epimerase